MPPAIIAAVAWIGAEIGSAVLIMYAVEIGTALVIAGGLAYSAMKSRQAKSQARDAYNAAQVDRMVNITSATAPRDMCLGRVRKGGMLAYKASTGQYQKDLYLVIALAGHEIDAIEGYYLNDELVTVDGSGNVTSAPYATGATLSGTLSTGAGVTATLPANYVPGSVHVTIQVEGNRSFQYRSQPIAFTQADTLITASEANATVAYQYTVSGSNVKITNHLGGSGQTVDADLLAAFPTNWASTNIGQGVAYVVAKLTYSEASFPSGAPNLTVVLRGAKLYDPRTGTTVWSENPALMMRHVYAHPKFGKATITAAEDARFIAAANACDTSTIYTVGGVAQAACAVYRGSLVLPYGAAAKDAFDDLAQAMGGSWAFAGGEIYLKAGVYTAPVMTLDDTDLAVVQRNGSSESQKPIAISVHKERAQKFNTVKVKIWNQAQSFKQSELTPLVASALVTRDGVELVQEVTYPAIGHAPQALHVAGVMMRDARDPLTVDLPFKLRAYPLELFDTVSLTLSRYGWTAKTFMVLARVWNADGTLSLTLKETSAAITQMDSGFSSQGFAANTNLPKPWEIGTVGPLTVTSGTAELLIQADGTVQSRMRVTWAQVTDISVQQVGQIEVQYRAAGSSGAWTSLIVPGNETTVATTEVLDFETYVVRARCKTKLAVSDWSSQVLHQVTSNTIAPTAPTATVTGGMFQVMIAWTFGDTAVDVRGTEVWWAAANDRTGAARLTFEPFPATSYAHIGLSAGQGGYYWVRVSDTNSNLSAWYPSGATAGLHGVASADTTALLTQLNNALDVSQLTSGLNTRIDLIDGNTTQPALPYPLVKIAALQDGLNQGVRQSLDTTATQLLDAVTMISNTNTVFRDAGVYTDPADGVVKIYGLEAAKDHLNTVDVTLSAQSAAIALKASTVYVDNAIATAVIDPTQVPVFTALETRVTSAEANISGLTGTVALKAATTDLSATNVRVTTAESNITSLTGSVATKVSQASFDAVTGVLDSRLGSAETTLTAFGDASTITSMVVQGQSQYRVNNATADELLKGVLNNDATTVAANSSLAMARQELTAYSDAGVAAEAKLRTDLAAVVSTNAASNAAAIVAESVARATADGAEASARETLAASVTALDGTVATKASITYVDTAKADAISAAAATTALVSARLDSGDYAAVKTESSTTASAVTGLKAKNTVTLDVHGYVSGTESVNTGTSASFTVLADKFLVAKPDGSGTPIPMMGLGTVNGVTALGINGNLIVDGSLNAQTITAGTITTDRLISNSISETVLAFSSFHPTANGTQNSTPIVNFTTITKTTLAGSSIYINAPVSAWVDLTNTQIENVSMDVRLYRDGALLTETQRTIRCPYYDFQARSFTDVLQVSFIDTPAAGSHTYLVTSFCKWTDSSGSSVNSGLGGNASGVAYYFELPLMLQELKK